MARSLQTLSADRDDAQGGAQIVDRGLERDDAERIPAVCFITDLARILRMSRRSIERLRRHGAFPIAELPALDARPRWSGDAVQRWLTGEGQMGRSAWRRRVG